MCTLDLRGRRPFGHRLARALTLAVVGAALVQPCPGTEALQDEPLSLHYHLRPPYSHVVDGAVLGLVTAPVERAFHQARVPFKWVETPVARQFMLVRANLGRDCLAGRFKNPERETWARFSKPVYRDQPQGLLVRADNSKLAAFTSMQAAVTAPEVAMLVKLGNSYGLTLDGWLAQRATPPRASTDENLGLARQIEKRMADAFIVAPEEAQALMAAAVNPADFKFLKFPDAPLREPRHIMCSLRVPQEVIDKLNAAIGDAGH